MIDVNRGPEPVGLRVHGYSDLSVRERLREDFRGKCYLCENALGLGEIQVDHRVMQSWDASKVNTWENLFPAHGQCNNRRPRTRPPGDLLSPGEGVEQRLLQQLEDQPGLGWRYRFAAVRSDDLPAQNAAKELDHLHNAPGNLHAADLHSAIRDQVLRVYVQRDRYMTAQGPDRDEAECHLRILLSREAPFTALLRSHFPDLHPLFD